MARWLLISFASALLPERICALGSQSRMETSLWAESSARCPFTVMRQERGDFPSLMRFFAIQNRIEKVVCAFIVVTFNVNELMAPQSSFFLFVVILVRE